MFNRILVPIDGSTASKRGLATALRMARQARSAVLLLHIVDENVLALTGDYAGSGAFLDRMIADLRAAGRRLVEQAAATATRQGVKPKTVLIEKIGPRRVADIIVAQARKLKADVIVIGTHGRRGVQRLVMGSDAEEVVRQSPVPVVLVRSGTRGG